MVELVELASVISKLLLQTVHLSNTLLESGVLISKHWKTRFDKIFFLHRRVDFDQVWYMFALRFAIKLILICSLN